MGVNLKTGNPIPLPICAVCEKEIEHLTAMRRDDVLGYEVIVRCHGDKERCMIYDEHLTEDGPFSLKSGRAFEKTKALPSS